MLTEHCPCWVPGSLDFLRTPACSSPSKGTGDQEQEGRGMEVRDFFTCRSGPHPVVSGLWAEQAEPQNQPPPSLGVSVSTLGGKNLERGGRERKEGRVRGTVPHLCK